MVVSYSRNAGLALDADLTLMLRCGAHMLASVLERGAHMLASVLERGAHTLALKLKRDAS